MTLTFYNVIIENMPHFLGPISSRDYTPIPKNCIFIIRQQKSNQNIFVFFLLLGFMFKNQIASSSKIKAHFLDHRPRDKTTKVLQNERQSVSDLESYISLLEEYTLSNASLSGFTSITNHNAKPI